MKTKNIANIINRKFDKFTKSITDESVRKLVEQNSLISGGCIASMLLNEEINDFDIYFTTKETARAVASYYVNIYNAKVDSILAGREEKLEYSDDPERLAEEFKPVVKAEVKDTDDGVEVFIKSQGCGYVHISKKEREQTNLYLPMFLTTNAITLTDDVQLILRFTGDPEVIHSNFDFIHCTNYWTSETRRVVLNQEALESLITKELRYVGSKFPLCSIIRTRKFIQRGFHLNAAQYVKMCFQLNNLDLKDIHVLKQQLTGVDALYFMEFIDELEAKFKSGEEISESWVAEVLDKVFDEPEDAEHEYEK